MRQMRHIHIPVHIREKHVSNLDDEPDSMMRSMDDEKHDTSTNQDTHGAYQPCTLIACT
jgi:hypothetical protein